MDDVVGALAEQHAELDAYLADLGQAGWTAPSACDGWSVADVVLHLAQTDEMAISSLTGDFEGWLAGLAATDVDAGADELVARERAQFGPAEVFARWRSSSARLRELLDGGDPRRRVTWVVGQLTVRTLATTRLAECWIHTGDAGVPRVPVDRLHHIARLAWRTVPYAFERAGRSLSGPVAFELTGPGGEAWTFAPDEPAATVVRGDALDLCLVAGQRAKAADTGLRAEGPDAAGVLDFVRTFA